MDNKKKKLLVTASTFPRWEGDTEPRFVLDLSAHMADEYDVTVLVPMAPGAKNMETMEGVTVVRYHYFPIHKWETLCYPGAIVPRIKEKKIRVLLVPFLLISLYFHLWKMIPEYDIVHAHWLIPQGIVQSFFKKPYIVTGHGGDVTSLNKGLLRKLKIRCLKKAKHVTVVSEHLKKKVQELVPELQPSVISMGVDTSKFGKHHFVENYFGQGEKKVILFVGRLAEKKGVTYLVEAMNQINAMLVIVGDGPLRAELEKQANKISGNENGEKIKFLGAKTHEELKKTYASADMFVAPSITAKDGDQEGVPTTIMEAMASGLPVVSTFSGGIAQLIQNGKNGFLCKEKDVNGLTTILLQLLNDSALYKEICINANAKSKKLDYSKIALQYEECLCYAIGEYK